MTKQRMIILETIREVERHMTAEEIFEAAKEKMPNMAMATIYNNLKALTQEGKIRRIQVAGEPDRYDRNMIFHEHLVCEECGEMTDAWPGELKEGLEKKLGIALTRYQLTLYHVCDSCQAKLREEKLG